MNNQVELVGSSILLRICQLSDCTEDYVSWLNDPNVNQYLETRFSVQTLQSIRSFVDSIMESDSSYLFAIVALGGNKHIGNIKLGPIHPYYLYADVSYFIGDRGYWGKGIATEAIRLVTDFAFSQLRLHRVQAGVFECNVGSIKALEKSGFVLEGRLRKQLRIQEPLPDSSRERENDCQWQDHFLYGILNEKL